MEPLWLVDTAVFNHPFTCLVAGPTQSGKTYFVQKILENKNIVIEPRPDRIIYCYSSWQTKFDDIKNKIQYIEFHEGIKNIDEINPTYNNLIIFDDLLNECEKDESILNLFTVHSHHKNISVFILSQNLYSRGKFFRTISLNCHYLVIFKNPRDKSQLNVLARQLFPNKINFFLESFLDAVENKAHSYIFVDLKQSTLEKNRVQTGIIPGENRYLYTPK